VPKIPSPVPLADLDPPVARAVVAVLTRAGLPAAVAVHGAAAPIADELTVVVPESRREEALATMAASMEDIRAELDHVRPSRVAEEDDQDEGRPLLFERLRSLGFLPVLLVPLLVVTLSQTRLAPVYAIAIIVGGGLVLVAWRDGRRKRDRG
jgi:hypothetical protein